MSVLLECRELSKSFGSKKVLDHVNFTIDAGKITGLLGPNGAGKTTLLKLANGLLQPDEGKVLICDKEPGVETKAAVSYLPDRMYMADWMKVGDIVDMFDDFYSDFNKGKALEMCRTLHIEEEQKIKNLSKGNQEKMQLMLVMSRKAKLYLLDEPIGGVDPAAREFILKTIIGNYNEEGSVLISTHLIGDVEQVLDDVIFLNEGRVILKDSVDSIRETTGNSVDSLFREKYRISNTDGGEE